MKTILLAALLAFPTFWPDMQEWHDNDATAQTECIQMMNQDPVLLPPDCYSCLRGWLIFKDTKKCRDDAINKLHNKIWETR